MRPPVFVVAGGKVGVGTSTLAAGLATTFASTRTTLLVEVDEGAVSLARMLGVDAPRTAGDLLLATTPELVLTPAGGDLTLVAGRDPALPALSAAQRATLHRRLESMYDRFETVVVDAGSRAAAVLAACAAPSASAIVVTTDDRIAAAGAYALEKLLHLQHPQIDVRVVGNMQDDVTAFGIRELLSGATQQFLGRPLEYAGTVPADPALAALLAGRTPDTPSGDPRVSPALMALAEIGGRALDVPGSRSNSSSTGRSRHATR